MPDRIDLLKDGSKGAVYRLASDGDSGASVIAKRCRPDKGRRERLVYEQVLTALPEPPFGYYGAVDAGQWLWLFIEDAGDQRLRPSAPDQRAAAALWFAQLHAAVGKTFTPDRFPDRGPEHYAADLESLQCALRDSPVAAGGGELLVRLARTCSRVAAVWPIVETLCSEVPRVFSHNDCLPKNVHVRHAADGIRIAAFDWGGAGWAPLGADLGLLALPHDGPPDVAPDYAVYIRALGGCYGGIDEILLGRLASIGQLFWGLKVASRGIAELADYAGDPCHRLDKIAIYEQALARSARALQSA